MVSSVSSIHAVHGYLRVLVVSACADNQRPSVDGVDGIVHKRVVANKGDDIIWEVLGGSHVGCKCPAWALKKKIEENKLIKWSLCLNNNHFQNT